MKVKDVLARIGDKPLIEALTERGYHCFGDGKEATFEMAAELEARGYEVFDDDENDKMVEAVRGRGYEVMPEEMRLQEGFDLYRSGHRDGFRQWLRDLFYWGAGRII